MIRFDIIFYVRMRDGISQIIISIEAQKDDPKDYKLLNRAVFYVSRLVSSQKERDFVKTNYDDIKQVFSLWVCMNLEGNSLNYIHLTDEKLGAYSWKGGLDLLNIVMIGITEDVPEYDEKYELHRLLETLLSMQMSADEKIKIMKEEYNIPVNDDMRKDVGSMCNLSQGIIEKGRAEGRVEGRAEGRAEGRLEGRIASEEKIILNMYQNQFTLEQIALATNKKIEEIQTIIEKKLAVLV